MRICFATTRKTTSQQRRRSAEATCRCLAQFGSFGFRAAPLHTIVSLVLRAGSQEPDPDATPAACKAFMRCARKLQQPEHSAAHLRLEGTPRKVAVRGIVRARTDAWRMCGAALRKTDRQKKQIIVQLSIA
jgi:hypothetical protein